MKANEFVKKHGWEAVIEAVKSTTAEKTAAFESKDLDPILAKDGSVIGFNVKVYAIPYIEVENLVESFETVGMWGGLPAAKAHLESLADRCANGGLGSVRGQHKNLKQAIADVESCMEVKSEN